MALGTAAALVAWLLGVWPPPVWWRDHWPRETAIMRERAGQSSFQPTALKDIAPVLQRMVIIGEDSRFRTHHGIDPAEIADALGTDRTDGWWPALVAAWRRRDRLRGASTITQQLAKNLYLSASRNPFRKVKEGMTALRFELTLPKDRILELYLNVAEWGPGIWGAAAASRAYFGVPAVRLDDTAAAALAATLPHPLTSNPRFRPERSWARRYWILARYRGVDVEIPPEEDTDSLAALVREQALSPAGEARTPAVPVLADSAPDSLRARPPDERR